VILALLAFYTMNLITFVSIFHSFLDLHLLLYLLVYFYDRFIRIFRSIVAYFFLIVCSSIWTGTRAEQNEAVGVRKICIGEQEGQGIGKA
jgi:hypothetical protein